MLCSILLYVSPMWRNADSIPCEVQQTNVKTSAELSTKFSELPGVFGLHCKATPEFPHVLQERTLGARAGVFVPKLNVVLRTAALVCTVLLAGRHLVTKRILKRLCVVSNTLPFSTKQHKCCCSTVIRYFFAIFTNCLHHHITGMTVLQCETQ